MGVRRYSDIELAQAIADSRSWRGVLRALALNDSSAGSLRAARRRADQLGITYGHFTGQRTWSDEQLRDAVVGGASWSAVATALGSTPDGGSLTRVRTHALRLGLSLAHLESRPVPAGSAAPAELDQLRTAAPMLASCWFTLHGYAVSWPLEPQRYDLLVERNGVVCRVQVKSTTALEPTGGCIAISNSRAHGNVAYSADEIDSFFLIDRELNAYLVPRAEVPGRQRLTLRAYVDFQVMTAGDLLDGQ